jgi:hypothetical protein
VILADAHASGVGPICPALKGATFYRGRCKLFRKDANRNLDGKSRGHYGQRCPEKHANHQYSSRNTRTHDGSPNNVGPAVDYDGRRGRGKDQTNPFATMMWHVAPAPH